jgi:hypothetical protein
MYPYMDYGEVLMMGNLERLKDRRERLCEKLFREIEENEDHKLHVLLPETNKAVHDLVIYSCTKQQDMKLYPFFVLLLSFNTEFTTNFSN